MKTLAIVAAMCLALVACKTAEESLMESGKKPLTSAQIKELYSGKTMNGTSTSGRSFQVSFKADGQASFSGGNLSDTGKWWAEGSNLYCSQWTKIRKGEKSCRRVYDLGNGKYQSVQLDGSESSTFSVKK